jgi:hypothetical protein
MLENELRKGEALCETYLDKFTNKNEVCESSLKTKGHISFE